MSSKSIWWPGNVDITCSVNDVIDQIPTSELENALEERKDLQKEDLKEYARQERYRTSEINVTIDPSDYDLVDEEDINISDFEEQQIIDYIEGAGYCVFKKGVVDTSNIEYDGYEYFITEVCDAWYCAYIILPEGHKYYGVEDYDSSIFVLWKIQFTVEQHQRTQM